MVGLSPRAASFRALKVMPIHYPTILRALLLILGIGVAVRVDAAAPKVLTFDVVGAECPACFYSVADALRQVKGVQEIEDANGLGNRARIRFDPALATAHELAHAVWRAFPLHGKPYQAVLRLRVPAYSLGDNAAAVDGVLAAWKQWMETEVIDRKTGEIALRFRPLTKAERKASRPGWSLEGNLTALTAPPPKGLGLTVGWMGKD